jgi:precorrin-8X/cobalt-precorrin-8 methylmutase
MTYDYLRNGAEIWRRSLDIVRAETDLSGLPGDLADVAARMVLASGMPDIVRDLAWTADVAEAGREALGAGAAILTDSRMVLAGIIRARLPAGNPLVCSLYDPAVAEHAERLGTTRSAASVDLWEETLAGAVVAIGNAPTALFRLIEVIREGAPRPAAILGFPVGFVGAAEAKQALIDAGLGVPYLTLRGRRGGPSFAASAVNALSRSGV